VVSLFTPDEGFITLAESKIAEKSAELSDYWKSKYEKDHAKNWNLFYKSNQANFFKDRHYLTHEFDLAFSSPTVFIEVGCGVGNALIPLVESNPMISLGIGLDISSVAIDLLNERAEELNISDRCKGIVHDMAETPENLPLEIIGTSDYVSLIFSLSACHPSMYPKIVKNVADMLKIGGKLLFRDYAKYDLAQLRFAEKGSKIGDNFYVRGDGTKAKFFTTEEIENLLSPYFDLVKIEVQAKNMINRKTEVERKRLWLQGVWVKK
jgi:SAM-dependent methyltransferase